MTRLKIKNFFGFEGSYNPKHWTDNKSPKSRCVSAKEREHSQSTVKGKQGAESMWVGERRGESIVYSLGYQFNRKASKPP